MYKFLRPLLFRLAPETAHQLTLQAVRFAGKFPPSYRLLVQLYKAPNKPVEAFGLTFKNPIGLAAGYDKDAVALRGLAALGFGHVEVGTVTPMPQPGNPRPEGLSSPGGGGSDQSHGISRATARRTWSVFCKAGKGGWDCFVLSSGPAPKISSRKNQTGPTRWCWESTSAGTNPLRMRKPCWIISPCCRSLHHHADYLAINISSPNTVGLRQLQGRAALEGLLTQLDIQRRMEEKKLEKRVPLLVKLAPDLSEEELDDAAGRDPRHTYGRHHRHEHDPGARRAHLQAPGRNRRVKRQPAAGSGVKRCFPIWSNRSMEKSQLSVWAAS